MESSLPEGARAVSVITERMARRPSAPAVHWRGTEFSCAEFQSMIRAWHSGFRDRGIAAGTVCAVLGDYSPQWCALVFALMRAGSIIVPLAPAVEGEMREFLAMAGAEILFRFSADDRWTAEPVASEPNALIRSFLPQRHAGLVVFTSGSTGRPKGILHDCERVLRKFLDERPGWRTVLFLMPDHFGGFNTLLSVFAYGGTAVCLPDRKPDTVCRVIEESRAALLPTTPTFLNLLLASNAYRERDLSSIRLITYGTEVMPASTLERLRRVFPNARVKQTYGLSELGVLKSQSESDDSLWVRIGGLGFETKVVDNILWIRSEANMVGYLNMETPFDSEGWMCTGDYVEVKGEYLRILGRDSDMINVGGQKVFPAEVESVLLQAGNVKDARVYGARHPLMGHVVHAEVALDRPEDPRALAERLRAFCVSRMARYKIPVRFTAAAGSDPPPRLKKLRTKTP